MWRPSSHRKDRTMERIFAIGDIHGCLDKLQAMMETIHPDREKDGIVFIGDYIDRGPDSRGVVDYVLGLKNRFEQVVCLKGNHEEMFLDFHLHGRNGDLFLMNGGDATLLSYGMVDTPSGKRADIPEEHLRFFLNLLPYYETEKYIFVHAGLRPRVPLEDQYPEDLFWIRHAFIRSYHDFGKIVVFGHTPLPEPLIDYNKIGIDTGAVYGGQLTCVELPAVKIYQV